MPITTLFFDLDGTLSNNFDGILRSLNHALTKLEQQVLDEQTVLPFIGPPFRESLPRAFPTIDVELALELYRERYEVHGWSENQVYDGITDLLPALQAQGYRMAVCTSKPRIFAERIVEHFQLTPYFSGVHGPELDGRFDRKTDLISHLLEHYEVDPREVVMIGDRNKDIAAARHGNTRSVGVLWGFGDQEELRTAGAEHLIAHPRELPALLATL